MATSAYTVLALALAMQYTAPCGYLGTCTQENKNKVPLSNLFLSAIHSSTVQRYPVQLSSAQAVAACTRSCQQSLVVQNFHCLLSLSSV